MVNWTLLTQFPLYAQCTMLYLCMEWTCCPVSLHLLVQSADFIILFPSIKLAPLSLWFLWLLLVPHYFAGTNVSHGDKIATANFSIVRYRVWKESHKLPFSASLFLLCLEYDDLKNNAPWKEQHSHNLFGHHQWFVCLYGWIDYRVESSRKTTFILRERLIYTIHHSLGNLRAELSSPVIYQLWSSYFLFHNWTLSKFDSNHMHPDSLNNPCQLNIFCFITLFVLLVW